VDSLSESVPLHISKVFPNPSNNLINLEVKFSLGKTPDKILVYDIMGNTLLSKPYSTSDENKIELNISNLSAGLYFVKLSGKTLESKPKSFSVY